MAGRISTDIGCMILTIPFPRQPHPTLTPFLHLSPIMADMLADVYTQALAAPLALFWAQMPIGITKTISTLISPTMGPIADRLHSTLGREFNRS